MSLGDLFGSDDSEAQDYLKQALAQYQQVNVPSVSSETVNNLPQQTVQGTVNPNEIKVAEQAPSAYSNISLDPSTRQAQINALDAYQTIANNPGLDPAAKVALQQTIDAANVQDRGAQGAIMKTAQAEGQGGGDFALTQRAIESQGASNNAATQGLQAAAMAEANKQNALNSMASIGSNVNAADFGQASTAAAAQNAINATNAGYKNAANTNNVTNNLTGQTANLQNAQNVNAANTSANQGNVYYNAGLPQQNFNNEMAKASGISGVNQNQAGVAQQSQANAANATGQLLKGATTLGATALAGPVGGMAANAVTSGGPAVGGAPPANVNTGQYSPLNKTQGYSDGGMCYADGDVAHNHYLCMLMGGAVPGEARVSGDSPSNDTVPARLSPGEIVVKRSAAANPDTAAREAKRISMENFVKGYRRGGR